MTMLFWCTHTGHRTGVGDCSGERTVCTWITRTDCQAWSWAAGFTGHQPGI